MLSPEPILDIVRGLSTVASGTIVLNQLKNIYEELFYTECNNCRGTGRMTCPVCHGRNKCRSRPLTPAAAAKLKMPGKYEEPEDSHYECIRCGDKSRFDVSFAADDDENEAYAVMDNLKAAMANKMVPRPLGILAGTVPCAECGGNPKVHLVAANLENVLNLALPWDFKVAQRVAKRRGIAQKEGKKQKQRDRIYLEYPSSPVMPEEVQLKKVEKKTHSEDIAGAITMTASDQLQLTDYVLKYYEDSDVEDT
ncbi:hypothetical protein WJX77_000486 [Trebouxia sp. C0004]